MRRALAAVPPGRPATSRSCTTRRPKANGSPLDCETTGLDVRRDQIISIGAVRIAGNRLLTSQRLELLVRPERALTADSVRVHQLRERDVAQGLDPEQAMRRLLDFIGSRPLVGYYLEFDVAMLNREIWPLLGVRLAAAEDRGLVDVLRLARTANCLRTSAAACIDLRFATMMKELELPLRDAHDALNDAVMAGLAFVKLRALAEAR